MNATYRHLVSTLARGSRPAAGGALVSLVLLGSACGVEKLEPMEASIPPLVQDSFNRSCALPSCHSGLTEPNLSEGQSGGILESNSPKAGIPYVVFGDLEGSALAWSVLGTNTNVIPIMPSGTGAMSPEQQEDVTIILGWIAGSPIEGGESGDDGDASDDDAGDSTTTSGGDTSSTGTSAEVTPDDVQAVFDAKCATSTACHELFPPVLTADVSYSNIVDAERGSTGIDYVEPGSLADSYLWQRMHPDDYDLTVAGPMPPEDQPQLTDDEEATLQMWIEDGAAPAAP